MSYRIENGKRIDYKFECIHCGVCCRFLDILIEKEDILKWIRLGRRDILHNMQIQPESISADFYIKAEMEGNLEDAKRILLEKHDQCQSERCQRASLMFSHMFLPELDSGCILIPQTFQIALDSMQFGLKYMLMEKNNGDCVFFTGHGCLIYEIKPHVCTNFPFEKDGTLAVNDWTLHLCKGIQRIDKD